MLPITGTVEVAILKAFTSSVCRASVTSLLIQLALINPALLRTQRETACIILLET
jgi:hypothetical protein